MNSPRWGGLDEAPAGCSDPTYETVGVKKRSAHPMLKIRLAKLFTSISFVALVAGCVGPDAGMSGDASGQVAVALAPDLTGTWRGSLSQTEASLYEDEANFTLQIKENGTFSATITRSNGGTNNLAKPVAWSGTVVRSGHRIVLRSSQEQWIALTRSGGDTLYGVMEDPVVEVVVTVTLKRAVDQS